jgi:hypothetical protein
VACLRKPKPTKGCSADKRRRKKKEKKKADELRGAYRTHRRDEKFTQHQSENVNGGDRWSVTTCT